MLILPLRHGFQFTADLVPGKKIEYTGLDGAFATVELSCSLRLMTTPGVDVLVALTFVSAVDAPERFRSSRAVGPHFGLTPKKYQSGETDHSGRMSTIGDVGVRTALYEAANVLLTRPSQPWRPDRKEVTRQVLRTDAAISPPEQGPFTGTMDGLGRYATSSTSVSAQSYDSLAVGGVGFGQFEAGLLGGEDPFDASTTGLASAFPGCDLGDETVAAFDTAVEVLVAQDADFDLDHVEIQLACLGV
ncbi:hypothetical protein ABIE33_006747 [Ensifer sp. 4252]